MLRGDIEDKQTNQHSLLLHHRDFQEHKLIDRFPAMMLWEDVACMRCCAQGQRQLIGKRRRRKREKTKGKKETATKKRGKREERDATHQKREPYIFFSFSSS
jgi:hypothetical protein